MKISNFSVKFQKETFPVVYIKKLEVAEKKVLHLLQSTSLLGVDLETESLPAYSSNTRAALSPHLSKVRLLQLFNGKKVYVFDIKYIKDYSIFIELLTKRPLVAHNAVFELQRLMQWGVKDCNIACSMLMGKLITHAYTSNDYRYDLESQIEHWFEFKILKKQGNSDWSTPELTFEQIEYAALDAVYTFKLSRKLLPGIAKFGLKRIYNLTKDVQHPVASMGLNGMGFDVRHHRDMLPVWKEALYKAKKKAITITGLTKITPNEISKWLDATLDEKTKSIWPKTPSKTNPKLSTGADAFSEFDYLPIIKPFSEYQKKAMLCSGFGQKLINCVNAKTGRIHGNLHICGARTGRFSCSTPNLQNCPRSPSKEAREGGEPDLRASFIADKGNVLICADYSMIEIRAGAELSRDRAMLRAFAQGIDLHKLTASVVSSIPLDTITKEQRHGGKAYNFGLMFGLGSTKYAKYAKKEFGVTVSQEKADADIGTWHDLYSDYTTYQQSCAKRGKKTLTCITPCGKLRKLPPDKTYGNSMNQGPQGGAAEVMMYALTDLYKKLGSSGKLINTVHDEIIVECRESHAVQIKRLVNDCMVSGFLSVFPKGITKDLVNIGIGKTWADAK